MAKTLLKLTDISKSFQSGDSTIVSILDNLSLEIQQGETIAITGPSGCGKSTLLNIMGTLDQPTSGFMELDSIKTSSLKEDELASLRSQKIGFVFQKHHLLPQLTALENVLLPTLLKKVDNSFYAKELLAKVGLENRLHHRPGQLSGGECQRVALCRALINKPILLLADEPTGALDSQSAEQLIDLLLKINREEKLTLVTVTHSAQLTQKMSRHFQLLNGKLLT